jgi:hypothetical protein
MKMYFMVLVFWFFSHIAAAQVEIVASPKVVCPGVPIEYSIFFSNTAGCLISYSVANGVFSNGQTTISGVGLHSVTVTWNNVPATQVGSSTTWNAPLGSLTVSSSNCSSPSVSSLATEYYVIKTLNGLLPQPITGNVNVQIGSTTNITYATQRVILPNTGVSPPGSTSFFYADSYEWLIPAGWQIGTVTSDGVTPIPTSGTSGFSVSVKPDACTGNGQKIKVRAKNNCGSGLFSLWQETATIVRNIPTPTFSQAPPNSVTCGNTTPITVSVNAVPGATSYTWTKPSGWGGTSTTTSITLTPNGTSVGSISVIANICGSQSPPVSKSVALQLFDPQNPPTINGALNLCSPNTSYTLANPPALTTATWSVSPSNLVAVSSGTGMTANLSKANSNSSGVATITFNLTGPCGPLPAFTKQIQVGVVNSSQATVTASCQTGTLCYVCPGNTYTFTAQPPLGHQSTYSYQWTKSSNWSIINQSANSIVLYVPQYNPDFFPPVRFSVNNGCGWSDYSGITVAPGYGCGGGYYGYSVYPNPASDFVQIEPMLLEHYKTFADSIGKEPFVIKIFDENGTEVLQQSSDGSKTEISIAKLKNGFYYIHIFNKEGILSEKIRIQR